MKKKNTTKKYQQYQITSNQVCTPNQPASIYHNNNIIKQKVVQITSVCIKDNDMKL